MLRVENGIYSRFVEVKPLQMDVGLALRE